MHTYSPSTSFHARHSWGSLGNRKLLSKEGSGQLRPWPYWMSSVNLGCLSCDPSPRPPPFTSSWAGRGLQMSKYMRGKSWLPEGPRVLCVIDKWQMCSPSSISPPHLSDTPEGQRGRINCTAAIRMGGLLWGKDECNHLTGSREDWGWTLSIFLSVWGTTLLTCP